MNTIIKEAKKKLSKFKSKKEVDEYIENIKDKKLKNQLKTYEYFYKIHKVEFIYQNIDYLTCKIQSINLNILDFQEKLNISYNHKFDIEKNLNSITSLQHIKLFETFYLINLWNIFNWQLDIYWIYDIDKNKIWSIAIANKFKIKKNNNVISKLELTWLFFKCYSNYLNNFLNYLDISRKDNDILKRIDYCLDIKWIEVFQLLEYLKNTYKRTRNVLDLTATDKLAIQNSKGYQSDMKYWLQETYKKILWSSNELKIYDKILDLIQPWLIHRKVKWVNPYQDYINSNLPITRLEMLKNSNWLMKMENHSIDFMFENIQDLFFDYLKRIFDCIDLSILVWENIWLNWKKIFLAKTEKEKDVFRCMQMIKSSFATVNDILWKEASYKLIYDLFPEIENIKPIELLDYWDIQDYFSWVSETI